MVKAEFVVEFYLTIADTYKAGKRRLPSSAMSNGDQMLYYFFHESSKSL